jgi:hypothetical protein
MWIPWLVRNDVCFNADPWPPDQLEHMIWDALQDHAKAAWKLFQTCSRLYPNSTRKSLLRSDDTWGASDLVCTRVGLSISWQHQRPRIGSFA